MKKITIKHEIEVSPSMVVGMATRHPDGRLVFIESGAYLRNGRASNFWYWKEINTDWSLGKEESGYGW